MSTESELRSLVAELYALVSGPGGQPRDWARQRELYRPGARMIRTVLDAAGQPQPEPLEIDSYGSNFERKMGDRSFYEFEVHAIVEHFGCIAHAFSSYEAYEDAERTRFLKRGINSIQFYREGGRWRIVSMIWDDERPGLEMPARYRGSPAR